MIQAKKFDTAIYDDEDITTKLNNWVKENNSHINVIDVKYSIIESGYECIVVIYEELDVI